MPPFTPCFFFFVEGFLSRNGSAFCSFLLLYFLLFVHSSEGSPPAAMKCAGTRHWGREVQATHLMIHSPGRVTMPTYPDCPPGSHSPFQFKRISLASLSALSTSTQMASFPGSTEQTQLTFVKISSQQQQLAGSLF